MQPSHTVFLNVGNCIFSPPSQNKSNQIQLYCSHTYKLTHGDLVPLQLIHQFFKQLYKLLTLRQKLENERRQMKSEVLDLLSVQSALR